MPSLHLEHKRFVGLWWNGYANRSDFEDFKVSTRVKISALWTAIMFCYIYADYFELYVPGKLASMVAGTIGPLGQVNQVKLIGTSILLVIPILLIFLSMVLSPRITRWVSNIFGILYAVVAIATLSAPGAWIFYRLFCVIEIFLSVMVVSYTSHWPKQSMPSE